MYLALLIFNLGLSADLVSAQNKVPKSVVTLTPEEKAWLKSHPRIVLGGGQFPPLDFVDSDGKYKGIGPEYIDYLGDMIGVKFEYITGDWADIIAKVKSREIDGIRILFKSKKREEYLNFTDPLENMDHTIVTRKSAPDYRTLSELLGKRLAVGKATRQYQYLRDNYPGIILVPHQSAESALLAVLNKEVDAHFSTYLTSGYAIDKRFIINLKFSPPITEVISQVGCGIRKDWPELVHILNRAIKAMPQKARRQIKNRYMALPQATGMASRAPIVELSAQERDWLDKKHMVRVRIVDYPPYQIINSNEALEGIVIEYLKLIEERTGIRFKYEVTDEPFAEFLDRMKQRQGPDMTAVIVPTPEREQYLSFSETYITSPWVIFTREQDNPILDISGLTGKTLAVPRSFVVQQQLDRDYPEIRQALYDSDEAALQAVATGQADAYIGNLTAASHIIHGRGFSHLRVAAPGPFGNQNLSMGNRNDWPELTSIINKALASITEEEKTAIRNKYLAINFEQGINKTEVLKWALIIGGAAAGVMLLFIFWNARLSKEISKRKQTEKDLKQAKDTAEAANQAKSLFLASMSHELRTPLNAILGFSKILGQEKNVTPDQQEMSAIIRRSGKHLLSMLNDILDLSKIEAERIELQEQAFDFVTMVKEVSVMIQSRAKEKGLSVAIEAESTSLPYVKADLGKLRQILINLLSNAVKFTDEGGVTIRCDIEPIPEEPKRCNMMIQIEDTGPGIIPTRQAQIFEPFVQDIDESMRKGTGLGLTISKKFAGFMGGTIELESEVGKGSLFRVRLPAEIAEAADVRTSVDDKPKVIGLAPRQKTWRILIADDKRENFLLLKTVLEEVGILVLEAENGKEAVASFKKDSPDFIWMDMRMPVMDGYEAVRQIRQLSGGNTIPIVAITASAFREQRHEVLSAGCDDMVVKPFQEHEIFEAMARFLDIEYVYEQPGDAAPPIDATELTTAMLHELPPKLLQELDKTTLVANRDEILNVIERIREHAPDAAESLQVLVQNFEIERIRELLAELG